jgi:hypothetical protein
MVSKIESVEDFGDALLVGFFIAIFNNYYRCKCRLVVRNESQHDHESANTNTQFAVRSIFMLYNDNVPIATAGG